MTTFKVGVGDTGPDVIMYLNDANGDPVPLTDAVSATLYVRPANDETPNITATLVIDDRDLAKVRYVRTAGDFPSEGRYLGDVKVIWSDGTFWRFPNSEFKIPFVATEGIGG